MQRQNSILKNTVYLAIAEVAKPLLGFLLIIIVSRKLGPVGVGAYTVIITFTLLIENISTVGLLLVFVRGIAADRATLHYYSSGAFGVALVSTCLFLPASFIALRMLHYPEVVDRGIRWLLCTLLVAILQQYALSICEGLQRMRLRSLISFLDTAGRVVVGVVMIALGRGVVGIIQGMVITRLLTTALGFYLLGPEVYASSNLRQSLKACPALFRAGMPFLLTTITSTVFWSVNTLMLSKMGQLEGVGIYNAASRLSDVLKGMIYSYLIALLPAMSASFAESTTALKEQCEDSLKYMAIISLPISAGVSILAPNIIRVVYGHKFDAAVPVLSLLVWTVSAFTISLVFARVLVASHNQMSDLYCNVLSLLINIACGIVLIPRFGPLGAGMAGLTSLVGFGVLEYSFVVKRMFRPAMLGSFLRAAGGCLVMGLVLRPIRSLPLFVTMPLGACVYFAALVCLGTFSASELTFLGGLVARRFKRSQPLSLAAGPAVVGEPES
jgi:O-antigen/teichoic acid export membrane protein